MVTNNSQGARRYAISTSRWKGQLIDVQVIGFARADSMQDLVKKLQIGEFAKSVLQPLKVSMFFTDVTDMITTEVSTPEELLAQLKKALA